MSVRYRVVAPRLPVPAADQDCSAPGTSARSNVTVAVADHHACGGIEPQRGAGIQNHAGLRLTTVTAVIVVVGAEADVGHGELCAQSTVHLVEVVEPEPTTSHLGLVGDDHDHVAEVVQRSAGALDARKEFELGGFHRSEGPTVPDDGPIDHPVTVEEDASR